MGYINALFLDNQFIMLEQLPQFALCMGGASADDISNNSKYYIIAIKPKNRDTRELL